MKHIIHNPRVVFIVLLLVIGVLYIPTLTHAFIGDDLGIAINGPKGNLLQLTSTSPLRSLLYAFTYETFELDPIAYRLPNILFHIGASFLLYLVASRLVRPDVGILASILFAVHPLATESVTWISGGVYAQYGFFLLLSFYLYARRRNRLSLLAYILAVASSEKAVILPLILIAYEWSRSSLQKQWRRTIPFLGISIITGLMHLTKISSRAISAQTITGDGITLYQPIQSIVFALSTYIKLFLWPMGLSSYHSAIGFSQSTILINYILVMGLIAALLLTAIKHKKLSFWLVLFLITLLPTLIPLKLASTVAERYVYVGLGGLSTLTAIGVEWLAKRKHMALTVYILSGLLMLGLSYRTYLRNQDWQSDRSWRLATLEASPNNPKAHNMVAELYTDDGDIDRAIASLERATDLQATYYPAYHNLGVIYERIGDTENAVRAYERTLELNPNLWQSYQNLAGIHAHTGNYEDAIALLKKALTINDRESTLYADIGHAYLASEEIEDATTAFRAALSLDPTLTTAQEGLSEVLSL